MNNNTVGHYRIPTVLLSLLCTAFSALCHSQVFGIYDSRALAMGGVSVANATTDQAAFYNPALLSFHDEYEEKSRSGRLTLPIIATQVSTSIFDIEDYTDDNLEQAVSDAINAFNASPQAQTALGVVDAAENIQDILIDIRDRPLDAQAYGGLAISEPSKREGGAFFLGYRALAGASLDITDQDMTLLNNYIESLRFVATNGQEGTLHPELFDANGNLIDNTATLNSSYQASGIGIIEAGVTFSKEFSIYSYPLAIGVTPKLWAVETYASNGDINSGLSSGRSSDEKTTFSGNADLGVAAQVGEYWRLGFSIRDLFSQTYATHLGGTIKMEAKARLGAAYIHPDYQVALDLDLNRTDPFSTGQTSQDISLGAEWQLFSGFFFRVGYRYDIKSIRAAEASGGFGYQWGRVSFDLAYAEGMDSKAASLQIAFAF